MFDLLKRDSQTLGLLAGIAIFLLIFDLNNLLGFPKSILQSITIPIQYGLYKSSAQVGKQFEFIALARRASQENEALTEQMAQVLSENSQLRKKLAETQGMVEQQGSLDAQTFNLVPARPLGTSRYLLIDKGSDDGLKAGQSVIYKDNFIGQIKEVSSKRAQVILSTDPDSKISAFAQNKDGRAKGILLGQFGSEMLLDKVLHEEPMASNDLIYSAGSEVEIPRGLVLGRVQETIVKDGEVFKQAKVVPVFDVVNLDVLFVVAS